MAEDVDVDCVDEEVRPVVEGIVGIGNIANNIEEALDHFPQFNDLPTEELEIMTALDIEKYEWQRMEKYAYKKVCEEVSTRIDGASNPM